MKGQPIGDFRTAAELLDLLRARQVDIGLTNESFERICDLAAGGANKYLGPTHEKWPGILMVSMFMDALGVSGSLWIDAAKVAKVEAAWRDEGKRKDRYVRPSERISKVALKRARPLVVREMGSRGGSSTWAKVPKAARREAMRRLIRRRWDKIDTKPSV